MAHKHKSSQASPDISAVPPLIRSTCTAFTFIRPPLMFFYNTQQMRINPISVSIILLSPLNWHSSSPIFVESSPPSFVFRGIAIPPSSRSQPSKTSIALSNTKLTTNNMTTKKRRQSLRTQKAPSTQSTAATTAVTVATTKTRKSSAKYTRPGVEAAANLVSLLHNNCNNDTSSDHDTAVIDTWERASSCYASMIKAKGGAKLVKLDKQRDDIAKGWNTTSKSSKSRSASSSLLSKEQLLDIIIEWKFTKGKPRHALKPLLKSNAHESVRSAVKRAFETANGIPANNNGGNNGKHHGKQITLAMKHLCELKGVGPATASSILCMYRPDVFAFMDDEVIECLYDGKRGYTMKIYMEVNDRCGEIADVLNNEAKKRDVHGDDGGNGEDKECFWTPCRVGKALWTVATMSAVNVEDGLNAIFEEGKKKKSRSIQNSRKKAKKS